jgi:hypothetical protein
MWFSFHPSDEDLSLGARLRENRAGYIPPRSTPAVKGPSQPLSLSDTDRRYPLSLQAQVLLSFPIGSAIPALEQRRVARV